MSDAAQTAINGTQTRIRRPRAKPAAKAANDPSTPLWPADRVSRKKVTDLVPYARNARLHTDEQVDQLAASMKEWGFTMPVLIDGKNEIIAGHGRVLAAAKLGLESVPVMTAEGWSPQQVKAYRIADNQLALNSAWNTKLLSAELMQLKGVEALIGFSDDDLSRLLRNHNPPNEFPEADENLPVEHNCPRCGFQWSGGAKTARAKDDAEED